MARTGRNEPKQPEAAPIAQVQDDRLTKRMSMVGISDKPIRTIVFMEIGNTTPVEARQALVAVQQMHGSGMHPTYVIPVRHGKFTGDILFEVEILEMVNKLCEVKDGQIVMKNDYVDVDVMRASL